MRSIPSRRSDHHSAISGEVANGRHLPVIAVLSTGGTISSHSDPVEGRLPTLTGRELLASVPDLDGFEVRAVQLLTGSSFALTLADLAVILRAVQDQLNDVQVAGVVITHGTDTLEETAYLLQLFHDDPRPVVLTGAIRPADDPGADGPANLYDALVVAGSPSARHRGVLIVFAGQIFAAAGTRKTDTIASAAFESPDFGALGSVTPPGPNFTALALHAPASELRACHPDLASVRVDIIATYPGGDDTALRACSLAGADGIVLEGTGSGNTTPAVAAAVAELAAAGVIIALSSRVHRGPVSPLYGGPGGGRALVSAGAIPAGWLRPSQARIALLALLATEPDRGRVRELFAAWGADPHGNRRCRQSTEPAPILHRHPDVEHHIGPGLRDHHATRLLRDEGTHQ